MLLDPPVSVLTLLKAGPGPALIDKADGQKLLTNLAASLFSHGSSFIPVQAELFSKVTATAS